MNEKMFALFAVVMLMTWTVSVGELSADDEFDLASSKGCRDVGKECVPETPGKLCCQNRPCRCDVVGQSCTCHYKLFEYPGR
uniref:U6-Saltitoxin-Pre1a_1 n=1 Tax=Phidippus regius TaxID=1905328 RepID=A0A482Z551_9ARAC